jgi:hypothetical protein
VLKVPASAVYALLELFNSSGERVQWERPAPGLPAAVETSRLVPGLYLARLECEDAFQRRNVRFQKIVLLP